MTAVGQEFFDFMKKLEENNDVLPADIMEPPLEFEYNTSSCYVCNGYYLPSFGEPICVACHAHLFPDFACSIPIFYFYTEKTDDDDSGNDEPSDLNFNPGSDRRLNRPLPNEPFYAMFQEEEKASSNGVVMGRGAVGGPPSLQSSLRLLSLPRPQENLPPQRLHELPPEVLLTIFSYLDDLSLCACGRVCERWRRLLTAHVPPARWAVFLERRWPLHRPLYATATHNWHKTYQSLVEASSCWSCLLQMALQSDPGGEENSWRRNRLRVEMKIMRTDPPEGIAALPLDSKCCHWQATITGPIGSPYEGGLFYLYLQVPYGYPMHPPVVRFLTRILHPNVSRHGDVGIDSVHHNWSLALTLSKVLISIQSLLTDPYTAVCMEPEVGELYRKDRVRFESLARQWTWRYAMLDALPPRSTYPSEE